MAEIQEVLRVLNIDRPIFALVILRHDNFNKVLASVA